MRKKRFHREKLLGEEEIRDAGTQEGKIWLGYTIISNNPKHQSWIGVTIQWAQKPPEEEAERTLGQEAIYVPWCFYRWRQGQEKC